MRRLDGVKWSLNLHESRNVMQFWRVRSHHAEGGVEGAEFDLNPGSDTAPSPWASGWRVGQASLHPVGPQVLEVLSSGPPVDMPPRNHPAKPRRWPAPFHAAEGLPEHPWNCEGWRCREKTPIFGNGQQEGDAKNQERAVDEQGCGKPEGHQLLGGSNCCLGCQDLQLWRTQAEILKGQSPQALSADEHWQEAKDAQKPPWDQLSCLWEDMQGVGDWGHLSPSIPLKSPPPLGDQEGSVHLSFPRGSKAEEAKKGLKNCSCSSPETRPEEPREPFWSQIRGNQRNPINVVKVKKKKKRKCNEISKNHKLLFYENFSDLFFNNFSIRLLF